MAGLSNVTKNEIRKHNKALVKVQAADKVFHVRFRPRCKEAMLKRCEEMQMRPGEFIRFVLEHFLLNEPMLGQLETKMGRMERRLRKLERMFEKVDGADE